MYGSLGLGFEALDDSAAQRSLAFGIFEAEKCLEVVLVLRTDVQFTAQPDEGLDADFAVH